MSDLRIALIAEGDTDAVIIDAALRAILPRPFVLKLLQPEATRPEFGGGWGGVLKWCRDFRTRGFATLEEDPTLEFFDLFVIHLDADVAHGSYVDCGKEIEASAPKEGWGALPCSEKCPPPDATVTNLKAVLHSWLGTAALGASTVLCIPSKASEAWLAAAVYPDNEGLLTSLECCMSMETRLGVLPKGQRIKKKVREYRDHSATIKAKWPVVRQKCARAESFHLEVEAISPR